MCVPDGRILNTPTNSCSRSPRAPFTGLTTACVPSPMDWAIHRLARAAEHGHFFGAPTPKRTSSCWTFQQRNLVAMICHQTLSSVCVCFNSWFTPHQATCAYGNGIFLQRVHRVHSCFTLPGCLTHCPKEELEHICGISGSSKLNQTFKKQIREAPINGVGSKQRSPIQIAAIFQRYQSTNRQQQSQKAAGRGVLPRNKSEDSIKDGLEGD